MTLSLLIKVSDLQNVSVIGHNSPTVNCKHFGGIYCNFCHNFIIQGVTWDGCGTELTDNLTEPVINLNYSFNVTIQNCSFQYSIGQALVLLEVSGDVNINNCNFVNDSHYTEVMVQLYITCTCIIQRCLIIASLCLQYTIAILLITSMLKVWCILKIDHWSVTKLSLTILYLVAMKVYLFMW